MSSAYDDSNTANAMTYSSEQMEEVWSWVHNEEKCVTAQTIAFRFGLSRAVASLLLRDLPYHSCQEASCYEVVQCVYREHEGESSRSQVKQSVVKLVKSELSINGEKNEASSIHHHEDYDAIVYSLALKDKNDATDSSRLDTAHEMDMATLRDQLAQEDEKQQFALCAKSRCTTILPLEKLERLNLGQAMQAQLAGMSSSVSHSSHSSKVIKRKATTAAAFFGTTSKKKTSSSKSMKKVASSTAPIDNSKETNKISKKLPPSQNTKKGIFAAASSTSISRTANNNRRRQVVVKETEEEKENRHSKTSKKKGTADDFVGDMDEDEEDEIQDEERRKRVAKRQAKEEDEKRKHEKKLEEQRQANRLYAREEEKQQPQPNEPPGRKRRKKMISKTFQDSKGYFHTEQQVVWEDIPDEELQAEAKAAAQRKATVSKKKPRNTKGMKQGNIMGFFKKK